MESLNFGDLEESAEDIFYFKQFAVCQTHAAMKVGTDSDLLGALAAGGSRILDIGTGTGVLSLMLAQRFSEAQISAVEIDDGAVVDAQRNFSTSKFADRIQLFPTSFQEYLTRVPDGSFDSVVCNPPYFHRSLECPDSGRTRARHSSSLPFDVLVSGTARLLVQGGRFSVCIPPEVHQVFVSECHKNGLYIADQYNIRTVPHRPTKRYVLVLAKDTPAQMCEHDCCMRNADNTRSDWYLQLMEDFLLCGKL